MKTYRPDSLNQVWLGFVLIHIVGSTVLVTAMGYSMGIILINSLLWGYIAYENRKEKAGIFLSALGWSLSLFLLSRMPFAYRTAFMMNMVLFCFLLFIYFGKIRWIRQRTCIGMIGGRDVLYIFAFTILFLVMAEFINAVSMLVFHNYVADSLASIRQNLWAGILVFAAAPAAVEEILFRGYLFERLGNGWKAVLISSLLFALGHMNFNQMCYAFTMGFLFAAVFRFTGNLSYTMVIHFLFNLYSVMMSAFAESTFAGWISDIHIFEYHPFYATFQGVSGSAFGVALAVGCFFFLLALCMTLLLLFRLRKKKGKEAEKTGIEPDWRPGISFFAGAALCLIIAITQEIL